MSSAALTFSVITELFQEHLSLHRLGLTTHSVCTAQYEILLFGIAEAGFLGREGSGCLHTLLALLSIILHKSVFLFSLQFKTSITKVNTLNTTS